MENKLNNSNDNDILLSIENLKVEYTSEDSIIHAVNGVTLKLKRGKALGLVGETGAGKTTIAKSILRILPDPPAKIVGGEINFEGKNILAISEVAMRKIRGQKISMIFQDPMTSLNPVFTVGEQIAEVIKLHNKISNGEASMRVVDMLEMVGIPAERYNDYPHQFSGGMKQRVVIAMALACKPELVLADEPTTALDVTIQAQVLEMMKKLIEESNTSLIMITHDMGIVAEICDDVAVIYAGEVIEYGSKEDIFIHPTHPYTIGLFDSIPSLTDDNRRLKPIAGMPPDPTNLPHGCNFNPRCPYRMEACETVEIPLIEISEGHFYRCIMKGDHHVSNH